MLVFGFLLGGVAAVLAAGAYSILGQLGFPGPGDGPTSELAYFIGVVGPIDGLVYAAAVAHGGYDAAVVTLGKPWLASLLVLAMWAFVIAYARRVVKMRVAQA